MENTTIQLWVNKSKILDFIQVMKTLDGYNSIELIESLCEDGKLTYVDFYEEKIMGGACFNVSINLYLKLSTYKIANNEH